MENTVKKRLRERSIIWKDFSSSKFYPCPSSITGNHLDDLLAVLTNSKPAAIITVYDNEIEVDSDGKKFSINNILEIIEEKNFRFIKCSDYLEQDKNCQGCERYFVYFSEGQKVDFIINQRRKNMINKFDPKNIKKILELDENLYGLLGYNRESVNYLLETKTKTLLENIARINRDH